MTGFVSAWLAIRARPDAADGSTIRINGDAVEVGKIRQLEDRSPRGRGDFADRRRDVRLSVQRELVARSCSCSTRSRSAPPIRSSVIDNGFYVFVLPGLKLMHRPPCRMLLLAGPRLLRRHACADGRHPHHHAGERPWPVLTSPSVARRQIGIWLMLNMFAWAVRSGAWRVLRTSPRRVQQHHRCHLHHGERHHPRHVHHGRHHRHPWRDAGPVDYELPYVGRLRTHRRYVLPKRSRRGSVPTVAIASAIVVSLVLTVAWPVLLQRFRVNPNAQEMESTYIQRNIDATRAAYGLGQGEGRTVQGHHRRRGRRIWPRIPRTSTAQIRLLDPQIVSPTFKQLQQSKQYYTFADTVGGRQVRRRRRQPGHGDRRARTRPGRSTTTATGSTTTPCTRTATAWWPPTATR